MFDMTWWQRQSAIQNNQNHNLVHSDKQCELRLVKKKKIGLSYGRGMKALLCEDRLQQVDPLLANKRSGCIEVSD